MLAGKANSGILASPRTVAIVGGGSAGLIAALTLKRWHPQLEITLIESSKIPVIGVGESTTSEIIPFLHLLLGIDVHEFYREVWPTWKLGIRFQWGMPGDYFFNYPFDRGGILESLVYDGHIRNGTALSILMSGDKSPVIVPTDGILFSALPHLPFGYHLDNRRFVAYLHQLARTRNIKYLDRRITGANALSDKLGVGGLRTDDGEELVYDFYVDCTGFRSLLLEQTLKSTFISYESSLWTDSAVIANARHAGKLKPYTTAETMECGWCWTIPQIEEDHLGYVFASSYISADQAAQEFRRVHPDIGECSMVRFRSGRHAEFCIGNVAALGNAYGFVEPLESTAIFVLCRSSILLASHLPMLNTEPGVRDLLNRNVASLWDYIRWFLSVHYRFNRRLTTNFWRDCLGAVDISGCEAILERYRTDGSLSGSAAAGSTMNGTVFDAFGYDVMLMGQRVPGASGTPTESESQYRERVHQYRTLAASALSQAHALRLAAQSENRLLDDLLEEASWVSSFAKYIRAATEDLAERTYPV